MEDAITSDEWCTSRLNSAGVMLTDYLNVLMYKCLDSKVNFHSPLTNLKGESVTMKTSIKFKCFTARNEKELQKSVSDWLKEETKVEGRAFEGFSLTQPNILQCVQTVDSGRQIILSIFYESAD